MSDEHVHHKAIQDRLADDVLKQATSVAENEELRTPFLALLTEDGRTLRYAIKTPGVQPHHVMKVLLSVHRATHAAICFEGWGYEQRAPLDDEEAARWKRDAISGRPPPGYVRPSEHPDRFDMLVLMSQSRDVPAGYKIHREWRIDPPSLPGGLRTFREKDMTGMFDAPSNFNPMFVHYDEIRGLIRAYAVLALIRDEARRGR